MQIGQHVASPFLGELPAAQIPNASDGTAGAVPGNAFADFITRADASDAEAALLDAHSVPLAPETALAGDTLPQGDDPSDGDDLVFAWLTLSPDLPNCSMAQLIAAPTITPSPMAQTADERVDGAALDGETQPLDAAAPRDWPSSGPASGPERAFAATVGHQTTPPQTGPTQGPKSAPPPLPTSHPIEPIALSKPAALPAGQSQVEASIDANRPNRHRFQSLESAFGVLAARQGPEAVLTPKHRIAPGTATPLVVQPLVPDVQVPTNLTQTAPDAMNPEAAIALVSVAPVQHSKAPLDVATVTAPPLATGPIPDPLAKVSLPPPNPIAQAPTADAAPSPILHQDDLTTPLLNGTAQASTAPMNLTGAVPLPAKPVAQQIDQPVIAAPPIFAPALRAVSLAERALQTKTRPEVPPIQISNPRQPRSQPAETPASLAKAILTKATALETDLPAVKEWPAGYLASMGPEAPKTGHPTFLAGLDGPKTNLGAVVAQIAHQLHQKPEGTVEINLHPKELGKLHFEMIPKGEGMSVTLSAEHPQTMELLRKGADQLLQELRDAGFVGSSINFDQWGQSPQQQANRGTPFGIEPEGDDAAAAPLAPKPTAKSGSGRSLDLRL